MKLVLNDEFGLYEHKGKAFCDSLQVAETFEKEHSEIIKTIEGENRKGKHLNGLLDDLPECRVNTRDYFIKVNYRDERNRPQPKYLLSRDGFSLLVFGFTGKKALKFKIEFINRFNQMEEFIKSLLTAKIEFPELTAAIHCHYEVPKSYHYSNELDMINKIVLGMTSKKYKEANGIPVSEKSIRPYLAPEQLGDITALQRIDIGLLEAGKKYEERKEILCQCHERNHRLLQPA